MAEPSISDTPSATKRRLASGTNRPIKDIPRSLEIPLFIPVQSGRIGVTRFHFNLDLTDDPVLPMRGMSATYRGEWWDSNTGTKKPFPVTELRTHFLFPLNTKSSAYLSVCRGYHSGLREHRDPSILSGGRTTALCLWRERADYQPVLLISDRIYSPAREAAPIFRRQHLPGNDLRSGENLLPTH